MNIVRLFFNRILSLLARAMAVLPIPGKWMAVFFLFVLLASLPFGQPNATLAGSVTGPNSGLRSTGSLPVGGQNPGEDTSTEDGQQQLIHSSPDQERADAALGDQSTTATGQSTSVTNQMGYTPAPTLDNDLQLILLDLTRTPHVTITTRFIPLATYASLTPRPTNTNRPTHTQAYTYTPSPSNTPLPSATPTITFTPTLSDTPTVTLTPTPSDTPTITLTPTLSDTPTITLTPTPSNTPTHTSTPVATNTPTVTSTLFGSVGRSVLLNELALDLAVDVQGIWIELLNVSDDPVQIDGWQLQILLPDHIETLPLEGSLQEGDFLILSAVAVDGVDVFVIESLTMLSGAPAGAVLLFEDAHLVDVLSWGDFDQLPAEAEFWNQNNLFIPSQILTMSRVGMEPDPPANWCLALPSFGVQNNACE
ncbi:MAG: hypothetical protein KIS80_05115 [Anaerolineales bacterium]|nr:hypothetical protein [Anaerolineales bacterium]